MAAAREEVSGSLVPPPPPSAVRAERLRARGEGTRGGSRGGSWSAGEERAASCFAAHGGAGGRLLGLSVLHPAGSEALGVKELSPEPALKRRA